MSSLLFSQRPPATSKMVSNSSPSTTASSAASIASSSSSGAVGENSNSLDETENPRCARRGCSPEDTPHECCVDDSSDTHESKDAETEMTKSDGCIKEDCDVDDALLKHVMNHPDYCAPLSRRNSDSHSPGEEGVAPFWVVDGKRREKEIPPSRRSRRGNSSSLTKDPQEKPSLLQHQVFTSSSKHRDDGASVSRSAAQHPMEATSGTFVADDSSKAEFVPATTPISETEDDEPAPNHTLVSPGAVFVRGIRGGGGGREENSRWSITSSSLPILATSATAEYPTTTVVAVAVEHALTVEAVQVHSNDHDKGCGNGVTMAAKRDVGLRDRRRRVVLAIFIFVAAVVVAISVPLALRATSSKEAASPTVGAPSNLEDLGSGWVSMEGANIKVGSGSNFNGDPSISTVEVTVRNEEDAFQRVSRFNRDNPDNPIIMWMIGPMLGYFMAHRRKFLYQNLEGDPHSARGFVLNTATWLNSPDGEDTLPTRVYYNDNEEAWELKGLCPDLDQCCVCSFSGLKEVTSGTCSTHGYENIYDVDLCRRAGSVLGNRFWAMAWGPAGGYSDVADGCSAQGRTDFFLNSEGTCDVTEAECTCSEFRPCLCIDTSG